MEIGTAMCQETSVDFLASLSVTAAAVAVMEVPVADVVVATAAVEVISRQNQ
jgi:hypothetical protein